jgi:hypothetical protein
MAETFGAKLHVVTVVQDIRNAMVAQYFPDDYEEKLTRKAAEGLSAGSRAKCPAPMSPNMSPSARSIARSCARPKTMAAT